jgi:peptidyl-prolyl cis-trans isomerase A (cyclophilin A)
MLNMDRRFFLAVAALGLGARASAAPAGDAAVLVRVETELGSFDIRVEPHTAPVTVANFLAYVDGRHLDAGSVYRLVSLANQAPETPAKIEVVQWGRNQSADRPAPFAPIAHETTRDTGLRHLDGTVSMARAAPGTASGEFFICIGDQPELDFGGRRNPDGQGFAAFGQVVQGMSVVRALHGRAGPKQFLDRPFAIRTVRRVGPGA